MFRKILTCLLLISLINFISCYSSEVISKKELDEGKAQIDFNKELYITTKDYTRYHFLPRTYQILTDTLYGEGFNENAGGRKQFSGKIAMNDITSFEQESLDSGASTGLTLGIIAVGLVAAGLLILASLSDAFNPD